LTTSFRKALSKDEEKNKYYVTTLRSYDRRGITTDRLHLTFRTGDFHITTSSFQSGKIAGVITAPKMMY
jgi:hypothetical protein